MPSPEQPSESQTAAEPSPASRPLSSGLQFLFGADRQGAREGQEAGENSSFFRAYRAEGPGDLAPFGIGPVDDLLGGGLDRGLTLVAGDPGSGRTLLAEEAVRSALTRGWWVYYAAYREGSLGAWERLMARASRDHDGLPLPLAAVRSRDLDGASLERLAELDAASRRDWGSRFVLVDRLPAGRDGLRALLDNVWWRLREAREARAPGPLVVIDDLETLTRLIREAPGPRGADTHSGSGTDEISAETTRGGLISRLDQEFNRLGIPGIATAGEVIGGVAPTVNGVGLRAGSLLLLHATREAGREATVELSVAKNARTGRNASLRLELDRRTGRLTDPDRP